MACVCCGRERGYVYRGPVYAVDELADRLCPWCIADGSAAERFDAHFTAGTCLGDDVPLEVFAAVDQRTPGFTAWQEPQWFFHCADGATFLGPAGSAELAAYPDVLERLRREGNGWGWPSERLNTSSPRWTRTARRGRISSGARSAQPISHTPTSHRPRRRVERCPERSPHPALSG
ncbi:CbrC family protein [Streptomyces sp. NPDC006530]|uniref:CbrC family protein n=1 Tax=Streptomyces sp. NPDC006530 TaxID=3364750 RepID=UPI003683FDBD